MKSQNIKEYNKNDFFEKTNKKEVFILNTLPSYSINYFLYKNENNVKIGSINSIIDDFIDNPKNKKFYDEIKREFFVSDENMLPFSYEMNDLVDILKKYYIQILKDKNEKFSEFVKEYNCLGWFKKIKYIFENFDDYSEINSVYDLIEQNKKEIDFIDKINLEEFKKFIDVNVIPEKIYSHVPLNKKNKLYSIKEKKDKDGEYDIYSYKISSFEIYKYDNGLIDDYYKIDYQIYLYSVNDIVLNKNPKLLNDFDDKDLRMNATYILSKDGTLSNKIEILSSNYFHLFKYKNAAYSKIIRL